MQTRTQDVPKVEYIYTLDQIIKQLEISGVNLGDDPAKRLNTFIDYGLLPESKNGRYPSWVVQRVIAIQDNLMEGKSLQDLKDEVGKERRRFLNQVTDLHSMVHLYKKFSSNSMFFLASLLLLAVVSFGFLAAGLTGTTNPVVVASENIVKAATNAGRTVAKTAAKPLGQTLVTIIKTSKDANSTSVDPLQLTNLEVKAPIIPGNLAEYDDSGNLNVAGLVTAGGFAGSGAGLTGIGWSSIEDRPKVLSATSISGNSDGVVNLVAGAGLNFTYNASADSLTIDSIFGPNADTLDNLDSPQFLRSDASDSFTASTLTISTETTLQVNGYFSCEGCIEELALADGITIPNYLALSGGTMAGAVDFDSNDVSNVGALGTNFHSDGAAINGGLEVSSHSNLGRPSTGNDDLYGTVIQGALCVDDGTPSCPAGPTSGAIYVENSVGAGNVSAFDLAEYYPASQPVEKGDVVRIDTQGTTVSKSSGKYDSSVLGIVSTDPAAVIDETNITFGKTAGDKFNPLKPYVALAGRVPTKVSTENGNIEPGDPLTSSSSTPGVAMKATRSGPIIGKALESYNSPEIGKVMVFVSTGWYVAPVGADVRSQMSDLSNINLDTLSTGSIETQILYIGERKLSMAKNGSLKIDGDVEVAGAVLAGQIVTDELILSNKTSGFATVLSGKNNIKINNGLVKEGSKVLVTFEGDYSPATRYWVEKEKGLGFTVKLDQPPSSNTSFSWVVIN